MWASMKGIAKKVTLFLLVITLAATCVPAAATQRPLSVVLPQSSELSDEELAQVKGEGLFAALDGFVAGWTLGVLEYVTEYTLDLFFGDGGGFDTGELMESAIKGGAMGFYGGLLLPTP